MSRKILLFIIGLFFLIGLGFLIYQYMRPVETTNVPTSNEVQNPFGNFFPTENVPTTPSTNNSTSTTTMSTITFAAPINNLRKIADVPIAGGVVFERTATSTTGASSSTVFRYVERATGHIYETTSTSTDSQRISNTTIPTIYEAYFLDSKNTVVFRYLDRDNRIDTYIATIKATTTSAGEKITSLEGVFMQKDISNFAVSPNSKNVLAISPNSNISSASKLLGQIAAFNNPNKQTTIFNSPLSIWMGEWFSNDLISFVNKASYSAHGVLYSVNARTGAQQKILGPIYGLSAKMSPNARKVLYSKHDGNGIVTNIYNISDNIYKRTNVSTLAEKCVWSKDNIHIYCAVPNSSLIGKFPDVWYMGLTSFNDSLVKINTELETTQTIMSVGSKTDESLDMINLQLSPKEDFLVFTNKRDLSFWSLDIKQD